MEKVSIVVPVYNCEPYLRKCLDSLLAQSYADIEILLIDDGSPDNSDAICREYSQKDERIRYFRKKNGGLSDARNYAIERASGDWFAFVDSDDYVDREYISKMYHAAAQSGLKIACCGYYRKTPDQERSVCYARSGVIAAQELWKSVMASEVIGNFMCNKLFAAELFEGIRFPLGKKYEDMRIFYQLCGGEKQIAVVADPLYYYVAHPGTITGNFTAATSEHFLEAADMLAAYIERTYPELSRELAAFRVRAHIDNMNGLMKTGIRFSDPHWKHSRDYLKAHWSERAGLSRRYRIFSWMLRWTPGLFYCVQRMRRYCART